MRDIKKDPFEEYIKNLPPSRKEMGEAWSAAIGLQDVDGLKPSEYLYETAKKNIDGEISIDEVDELINTYYETKSIRNCLKGYILTPEDSGIITLQRRNGFWMEIRSLMVVL